MVSVTAAWYWKGRTGVATGIEVDSLRSRLGLVVTAWDWESRTKGLPIFLVAVVEATGYCILSEYVSRNIPLWGVFVFRFIHFVEDNEHVAGREEVLLESTVINNPLLRMPNGILASRLGLTLKWALRSYLAVARTSRLNLRYSR